MRKNPDEREQNPDERKQIRTNAKKIRTNAKKIRWARICVRSFSGEGPTEVRMSM